MMADPLLGSPSSSLVAKDQCVEVGVVSTNTTVEPDSIEAYPPILLSANQSVSNDEANKGADDTSSSHQDEFVWDPLEEDILSGRGAKVNSRLGNKKFRSLCFSRKPEFDAGTHHVKRRVATEIVYTCKQVNQSRFLKRTSDDGPWLEMTLEASVAKACQVMRDHRRPDREAIRVAAIAQNGRKRERRESTPILEEIPMVEPVMPFVENPSGILENDVLSGRGAYVNGHMGNQILRKMAFDRKAAFDAGNFTEKQALASEIVAHIRSLDPPGRFMKKTVKGSQGLKGLSGEWEELPDDKALHKVTQVMRDIDRPDRLDRKAKKRGKSWSLDVGNPEMAAEMIAEETAAEALKHAGAEVSIEDVLQESTSELPPLETPGDSETVVAVAAGGLESV